MHRHDPSCLEGPFSRKRACWRSPEDVTTSLPSEREVPSMSHNQAKPPDESRPIRWELVERVRREIAAGAYDTPEKMEIAMDRLLKRLECD